MSYCIRSCFDRSKFSSFFLVLLLRLFVVELIFSRKIWDKFCNLAHVPDFSKIIFVLFPNLLLIFHILPWSIYEIFLQISVKSAVIFLANLIFFSRFLQMFPKFPFNFSYIFFSYHPKFLEDSSHFWSETS